MGGLNGWCRELDADLVSLVDELEANDENMRAAPGKAGSVAGSTRSILSSLGETQPYDEDPQVS